MFDQRCSELETLCKELERRYSDCKNLSVFISNTPNLSCLRAEYSIEKGVTVMLFVHKKSSLGSVNGEFVVINYLHEEGGINPLKGLHTNFLENLFRNPLAPTSTELEEFELETGYHYFLNENLELVSPETGEVL